VVKLFFKKVGMRQDILLKVFVAIILAVIAGWLTGPDKVLFGISYVKIYGFIGQLFLNALNLVVVPLVTASIIMGTSKMGSEPSFGILGAKTFGFYLLTSFLAVVVGLCGFLMISWGVSFASLEQLSGIKSTVVNLSIEAQGDNFDKITQILLKLVPSNIFAVASQGQMMGLILFSILFGFFISKIDSDAGHIVLGFWKGIFQIMMKITHLVMKALPIGIFGLVAKVIATTGIDSISSVAFYFVTVILSLFVYALIVIPMLLRIIGGINPILYFRAMAPALFTAFSTSSSAAALPIAMECLEKRAGVSNKITSFSLPLGTSLNMCGGALYLCLSSLFIAQSYGIELSLPTLGLIALLSLLTSMGIAGIPSASLISVVVILHTIGVPAEGIGLIMAVDRIVDMFRTTVNVIGNTSCAILLARSEGEQGILTSKSFLSPDEVMNRAVE
jgi:proton glutamate symport protein